MEITNISGPDTVPRGFSTEPPRQEETTRNEQQPINRTVETTENSKGNTVDTYA